MDTYEAARQYLAQGLAPIPVQYKGKRPLVKWGVYQNQLPTGSDLKQWFDGRVCNIGIVTGHAGLTVIDFDDSLTYARWLRWAKGGYAGTVASKSFRIRTARGMHVYLRLPEATRTRALMDGNQRVGVDIKSQGGYVLAPPSIHQSGAEYVAVNPNAPIMTVQVLSDILPAVLLTDDEQPDRDVRVPRPHKTDDPWQAASSPTNGDSAVEKIKSALAIEEFFPLRTKPAKRGRFWMARCPFHDDKNPSLWIDIERQRCGCFAGCTAKSLDVISLYARLNDLSNSEAIRVLARSL